MFASVQRGLLDQRTGVCLLEAQLVVHGLTLPQSRGSVDLDEALTENLLDEPTWRQLRDLNEANNILQSPQFSSEPLPAIAAFCEGVISEKLAVKVMEIQLATGGLKIFNTRELLTLDDALQFGLIPAPLYVQILERQSSTKGLISPSTAENVSLAQLVQMSVLHEETGLRLLPVKENHQGTIVLPSGRQTSVLRAAHEGCIDRETMLRLLGSQLFAGGIVDPNTGHKLTVEEALSEGLIDPDIASGILSHQTQNGGIVNPKNGKRLTVDEAVQCDLMSSTSALLVLEKQRGFMGLLWPRSGEILSFSTFLQHNIITNQLACKLISNRQKIAAFYIPDNSEVVDINSAVRSGLVDRHTVEILKTIEIPDVFPDIDDLNTRFSSWLMFKELQIEGCHSRRDTTEVDEQSLVAPSPSEAEQLFMSYLMLNSYMDPTSGKRLLIFDGQLSNMSKLLMEELADAGERERESSVSSDDDTRMDDHSGKLTNSEASSQSSKEDLVLLQID